MQRSCGDLRSADKRLKGCHAAAVMFQMLASRCTTTVDMSAPSPLLEQALGSSCNALLFAGVATAQPWGPGGIAGLTLVKTTMASDCAGLSALTHMRICAWNPLRSSQHLHRQATPQGDIRRHSKPRMHCHTGSCLIWEMSSLTRGCQCRSSAQRAGTAASDL